MSIETFDCFMDNCGRLREKATDLVCQEHWARVPKRLRIPLIEANKLRSWEKRREASIRAAQPIIMYLKAQKIQLPPAQKLDAAQGLIKPGAPEHGPGSLVQTQEQPKLDTSGKLILTDRR